MEASKYTLQGMMMLQRRKLASGNVLSVVLHSFKTTRELHSWVKGSNHTKISRKCYHKHKNKQLLPLASKHQKKKKGKFSKF
jgi:TusA-related sulfurtransferase